MTQFNTLVEEMAAMEHTRWSKWQSYLHSKCIKNEDGSLTIPAGLVVHWERQISTPYSQLTEPEKEADRREVRPYIEYATQTATRVREETEKAYGGCHYCYGKGYGTQTASWVGRGYYKKLPTMKFCTCERGKQLEELLSTLNK